MRMCCAVALPPHMIPVCAIIPASSFFPGEKGGEQRVVRLVSLQLFQVAMPVLLQCSCFSLALGDILIFSLLLLISLALAHSQPYFCGGMRGWGLVIFEPSF